MADTTDDGHKIVEGDGTSVPVRLGAGDASDSPKRPVKGMQLVWGGSNPSSPWGHLQSLIEAGGGSVRYTLLHATVLASAAQGKQPTAPKNQDPKPKQQAGDADEEKQHEKNLSYKEGAATGSADLFGDGHDFEYDNKGKKDARVWAHPAAARAGKVPLLVFLHGIAPDLKGMDCDYPQLRDDFAAHEFGCHLGHLARSLVDGRKVRPVAIAAPTAHDNKSASHLWRVFDLGKLVQRVAEELERTNAGFEIDFDEVLLAGHSGAGCDGNNGLYKVAGEHGEFKDKSGAVHQLRVLGFADTCASEGLAAVARTGLKRNSKTAIYTMFKGGGGGGQSESADRTRSYSGGYGATRLRTGSVDGPEDPSEFDDFRDNGGESPPRISVHFSEANAKVEHTIYAHEGEWIAAGAIGGPWPKKGQTHSGWATHYAMTMVWTWWALQRFCSLRDEDRRVLDAYEQQKSGAGEGEAPHQKREAAGDPGPDWEHVPSGPPAWHAPAASPRSNAPATFADPVSGRFWPVRTRSSYGRAVAFVGEDGQGHGGGPSSDPTSQRHFLAERRVGGDRWCNGGVDLYGDFGDAVVAAEEGTIARFEPLYSGVNKLLVRCTSGLVIHYGGVEPDSLEKLGLAVGDRVRAGQPIAFVGRMDGGQPMLHFETYPPGTKDTAACYGAGNLAGFLDPTAYLLNLAVRGR
jgi:murein DD-endopeptidase MepM/ murein hydrolase activator NlpD